MTRRGCKSFSSPSTSVLEPRTPADCGNCTCQLFMGPKQPRTAFSKVSILPARLHAMLPSKWSISMSNDNGNKKDFCLSPRILPASGCQPPKSICEISNEKVANRPAGVLPRQKQTVSKCCVKRCEKNPPTRDRGRF